MMMQRLALVYGYHALRYLTPVLTIAAMAHWLGKVDLAIVLVAQSVAALTAQIIEYGFGMAGARDVAAAEDANRRGRVVSDVLSAQLLLAIAAGIAALILVFTSPILREREAVLAPVILGTVVVGFGSGWYFQGTERVRLSVGYEGLGQLLSLGLLVAVLATNPNPIAVVWALYFGPLIATSYAWRKIMREVRVRLAFRAGFSSLRGNVALFLARASITSYTAASTWLMALLSDPFQTATYGAALRVLVGASALFAPLAQVMLPYLVKAQRDPSRKMRLEVLGYSLLAVGLAAGAAAHGAADPIADLILHNPACAPVIRVLGFTLPVIALSQFFAIYVLVPRRQDAYVAAGTIAGAVCSLALALALAPAHGAIGMSYARLCGEIAITTVVLMGAVFAPRPRGRAASEGSRLGKGVVEESLEL
jgi:PST family polysaccharide transporter